MKAKLFRTIDVVAVLTNVSLDRSCRRKVNELVSYVTGCLIVPEKKSTFRQDAVASIRAQLPKCIKGFELPDLVEIIMQINHGQDEDDLKANVAQILEDRYGQHITLCPEEELEAPSDSLCLLRSLVERPDTAIAQE